jgi:hypothetical protein
MADVNDNGQVHVNFQGMAGATGFEYKINAKVIKFW